VGGRAGAGAGRIPARVRFLSAEPLTEHVWLPLWNIQWVIVGGMSGPQHRRYPLRPEWARSVREQCATAGTAFFLKQGSGPRSGQQCDIPDDLWRVRESPA
jgi:protein gp37